MRVPNEPLAPSKHSGSTSSPMELKFGDSGVTVPSVFKSSWLHVAELG